MRVAIQDAEALKAVSPAALSAYARSAGWSKTGETYGEHSDVYVARGRPELLMPRTDRLGDYASVVYRLVHIFADVAETDQLSLYYDLVTADRDVIRVQPTESDDGTVALNDGLALLRGTREMILETACGGESDREVIEHVRRIRLGQTEHGKFMVTLLTPVVPPSMQPTPTSEEELENDPLERRMTRSLMGALSATRKAIERTPSDGSHSFVEAIKDGVSADLCDVLATLIEPFQTLDVSVTWARTRPRPATRDIVHFVKDDALILRDAVRYIELWRKVVKLITEGHRQSLIAISQVDYELVVRSHRAEAPTFLKGILDWIEQRWRLLNARVVDVISVEDPPKGS